VGGAASTSQGHPYTIFRWALERGNLMGAEATAKELPRLGLADALELTLLIARKEPRRHPRVAAAGCCGTAPPDFRGPGVEDFLRFVPGCARSWGRCSIQGGEGGRSQ
jgi:hypothetical protein